MSDETLFIPLLCNKMGLKETVQGPFSIRTSYVYMPACIGIATQGIVQIDAYL